MLSVLSIVSLAGCAGAGVDDLSFITVLHEPISAIWTRDGEGTYIVPL